VYFGPSFKFQCSVIFQEAVKAVDQVWPAKDGERIDRTADPRHRCISGTSSDSYIVAN
jgi:hypothetical protein